MRMDDIYANAIAYLLRVSDFSIFGIDCNEILERVQLENKNHFLSSNNFL